MDKLVLAACSLCLFGLVGLPVSAGEAGAAPDAPGRASKPAPAALPSSAAQAASDQAPAKAAEPAPKGDAQAQADQERVRELKKEIAELRRRLEGGPEAKPAPASATVDKIAELEAERDRLQELLDQPVWRFHEDRFSPRGFALDLGMDWGHTDNLGERRRDRVSDSYFAPSAGAVLGSLERRRGLALEWEQYNYSKHDEDDYDDVEFTAVLGSLWYRLRDVSETSRFVTDRIEMTKQTVALGDDWSVRHVADKQSSGPLDLFSASFISGDFAAGDLDYKALTVMVGPRWDSMQKIRRGEYDEGLGWQFRALGGCTWRWYDSKGYRDETALVGQLDFAYAAPRWVGELSARSRLEDDLFQKTGHKRVSDAGFSVEQGSGWIRIVYGAAAGMERYDQGDDQTGPKRRDFVARGKAGLDLRVIPHSLLSVLYVPEYHDSNLDGYDAMVNVIQAGLKLTF